MKIDRFSSGKFILFSLMLLLTRSSFSQYNPDHIYQHNNPSKYYPNMHDSAVTVKPKLIKSSFLYYGFLSSLNQHISFEYDKQMNDDIMLSAQVGIISTGFSGTNNSNSSTNSNVGTTTNAGGGYFEGGIKLFLNPDYTASGRHGYYTVEGFYLKPQFSVSIFTSTTVSTQYTSYYVYPYPTTTTTLSYSYVGAALLLNLGGQWMIAHTIAIDLYGGIGINFSNAYSSNYPFTDNYFSYLATASNFPLAFTGGINIGLPF